uniref:Uncharacterized protein n=1 Tax=Lepeophtheirus salmonis TaxID=72036 RepID=A0A0K2U8L8_LEPSM
MRQNLLKEKLPPEKMEMLVYMNAMLITSGLLICEASELTIIFFLIKNNDVYF